MTKKAEIIQQELERLRVKYKGRLTPKQIVKEARAKSNPLYKEFDWNVQRAAQKHWEDTARDLLTRYITVRVVSTKQTITCPHFVRDPSLPPNVQGYVSTLSKMDRSAAETVIHAELDRIESAVHRGRAVAGALDHQNPGIGIAALFEQLLAVVAQAKDVLRAA